MTLKNDEKSEQKLTCLKIDIRNMTNFYVKVKVNLKVSKIYTLVGCFWQKYIMFELKSAEILCLMVLNIDAKFEGKLTCAFKNDMKNLANFHHSIFESLKIGSFIGSFYLTQKIHELKSYRRVMCYDNKSDKKIEK